MQRITRQEFWRKTKSNMEIGELKYLLKIGKNRQKSAKKRRLLKNIQKMFPKLFFCGKIFIIQKDHLVTLICPQAHPLGGSSRQNVIKQFSTILEESTQKESHLYFKPVDIHPQQKTHKSYHIQKSSFYIFQKTEKTWILTQT